MILIFCTGYIAFPVIYVSSVYPCVGYISEVAEPVNFRAVITRTVGIEFVTVTAFIQIRICRTRCTEYACNFYQTHPCAVTDSIAYVFPCERIGTRDIIFHFGLGIIIKKLL